MLMNVEKLSAFRFSWKGFGQALTPSSAIRKMLLIGVNLNRVICDFKIFVIYVVFQTENAGLVFLYAQRNEFMQGTPGCIGVLYVCWQVELLSILAGLRACAPPRDGCNGIFYIWICCLPSLDHTLFLEPCMNISYPANSAAVTNLVVSWWSICCPYGLLYMPLPLQSFPSTLLWI